MVLPITIMTTRWNTAITNAFAFGAAIVFVAVFSELVLRERKNRTEVERLASELSEANRKLREYAMQAEELAVTRERNRLAREIHDTLGHYLTTVNMQLEAARALLDTDRNKAEAAMLKAQNLTREGLLEVRHSVASLRSLPVEGRTLREAIGALVGENATTGIITELVVTGEERLLGPQYELALYRAAQEALTNVRKHSLATQADVCLEYRQNSVKLSVKDNGTGASNNGNGFGLMGLRERVHLLGGDVSTITAPGEGFLLEVELRI
jgi:signal transduction histidine kinase